MYLVKTIGKELAGRCRLAVLRGLLEILTHHFSSHVDIESLTVQLVFSYPFLWQILLPVTLPGMKTTVDHFFPRKAMSVFGIYFTKVSLC